MSISKTGCSSSITKKDLDMAYKQGFADGAKAIKEIKKSAFLNGIEASKTNNEDIYTEEEIKVVREHIENINHFSGCSIQNIIPLN